ncbi:MAG: hypothetical protein ABJM43_19740 [Paracoccaceae bacterium]
MAKDIEAMGLDPMDRMDHMDPTQAGSGSTNPMPGGDEMPDVGGVPTSDVPIGTRSEPVGQLAEPVGTRSRERRPRRERGSGGSGLAERAQEFRAQAQEFRAQAEQETGHRAENLNARADRADAAADRMESAAGRASGGTEGSEDGTAADSAVGPAGDGMENTLGDGSKTEDSAVPSAGGTGAGTASVGGNAAGGGGQIEMQAEDATSSSGSWVQQTVDGETVMVWDASTSNYSGVNEGEALSYNFTAGSDGTHDINLISARVKSAMGADERNADDRGNDVHVRVTNVETGEVILQPMKLFTNLGGSDGVLKTGNTFDQNHNKSAATVDLDSGVEYKIDIIGRSDGYALDKITLNPHEAPSEPATMQPDAMPGDDPVEMLTTDTAAEVTDTAEDEPMDDPMAIDVSTDTPATDDMPVVTT